jgi:hypothetical protein
MNHRHVSIAPAAVTLAAGCVVAAVGYSFGVADYAWCAALILFMAAVAFFAVWVQTAAQDKGGFLRQLDRIRRAGAGESLPRPTDNRQ